MKKAKLILTAVGVLSVVGGAMALKANMRSGNRQCSETKGGVCRTDVKYTPRAGGAVLYCTQFGTSNPCTITQTVIIDNL